VFTATGVEKTGHQIADDPDAMAAEALKISSKTDNETKGFNKTQHTLDTLGGVSDRPRNVVEIQVPVNEIEVNQVDGMQPIPNQSSLLPPSFLFV
jgi:hypothetical protein